MNPHQRWCHNRRCRAYGRPGEGHIVIHSQKERRYQCKRCRRTFSETTDTTAFYRIHKPKWLVLAVVTLLAYGCPVQAIVAAFGIDARTVARWQRESGSQCRRIHEHVIGAGRVELLQVLRPTRSGSRLCRWSLLVSLCDRAKEQAMARFSDQPAPRRAVDPRAAYPGTLLWPPRKDPVGNRWTCQLQKSGSEGLRGGTSHRQGWPSETGAGRRDHDRPSPKALPTSSGRRGSPARHCG